MRVNLRSSSVSGLSWSLVKKHDIVVFTSPFFGKVVAIVFEVESSDAMKLHVVSSSGRVHPHTGKAVWMSTRNFTLEEIRV